MHREVRVQGFCDRSAAGINDNVGESVPTFLVSGVLGFPVAEHAVRAFPERPVR